MSKLTSKKPDPCDCDCDWISCICIVIALFVIYYGIRGITWIYNGAEAGYEAKAQMQVVEDGIDQNQSKIRLLRYRIEDLETGKQDKK